MTFYLLNLALLLGSAGVVTGAVDEDLVEAESSAHLGELEDSVQGQVLLLQQLVTEGDLALG